LCDEAKGEERKENIRRGTRERVGEMAEGGYRETQVREWMIREEVGSEAAVELG
jgi:hypothetical protein